MFVIASNAAVWWMLTLPRTIRVARYILVLNALISAFYGLFPVVYFLCDGVMGIWLQKYSWTQYLDKFSIMGLGIDMTREVLFGGTTGQTLFKIVTRLLPLFVSIR